MEKEYYENLQRAAGFDANRTYPSLFQHLGYRKHAAQRLLAAKNLDEIKELEYLYNQVNAEIKLIIGI